MSTTRALSVLRPRQYQSAALRQSTRTISSTSKLSLVRTIRTARPSTVQATSYTHSNLNVQHKMSSTSTSTTEEWVDVGKNFENIKLSKPSPNVALITLNRPKALNALCTALITEMNVAIEAAVKDDSIGAIVFTGNERAFAGTSFLSYMSFDTYTDSCDSRSGYQRNEGQTMCAVLLLDVTLTFYPTDL